MKIVMIGQKGIPTKSGGIEKHVEALSVELAKRKHEIIVYTRPHYTNKTLKYYKGVKLISLPSINSKHLDAASHSFMVTLHALFKIKNVDIIHYHGIGPSLFLWIPRIINPKIKVLSTFHCQDYKHQKWSFFARAILKLGELCSVYLSHQTIVVSKHLKKYVKDHYQRKAVYIPNGIYPIINQKSPNKSDEESLIWWNLKPKKYILTVNRLVRHKGIHTLIKAYQRLDPKLQQNKKLVIVGDSSFTDDYLKELKIMAQNNPNIIFTGQQTGRSLRILFQNAYLFVHPSESEGMSLSLLEALDYGIPVLISNIPANLEIAKNYGFVFKNRDYYDLSKKLDLILGLPNKILEKKSALAQKKIAEVYSWKKIVCATEKLYTRLLTSNKSRILFAVKIKKA
ncbi:glycosyltransferase [bacterium]|nr:MAG: glycosyltransferase [bacterium]